MNSIDKILKVRYCREGESSWEDIVSRVSSAITSDDSERLLFEGLMRDKHFIPNSPTLSNAGVEGGSLSACFVLPVGDSIEEIFDAIKYMALIHKTGGGTGFSFSDLREEGAAVQKTGGIASGPLSFMSIFDKATEEIKQGGRRRGANMGSMMIDHPDVEKFITSKLEGQFQNFNFSVMITDDFIEAVKEGADWELKSRLDGKVIKTLRAIELWDLIAESAWKCGDPGILFYNTINRYNCLINIAKIEATNPCGETPLIFWEPCNLGSINLVSMVKENGEFDFGLLRGIIDSSVLFLNRVIDNNCYPLEQITDIANKTRKIGLGVMGLADVLILMKVIYGSKESLEIIDEIFKTIAEESWKKSYDLVCDGTYENPFHYHKEWEAKNDFQLKNSINATATTIAPTGTISIVAGVSSGIEPLFRVKYTRRDSFGEREVIHPLFEKVNYEDYKKYVVTAEEIDPIQHLEVQATVQKWVDNAVSKTINLPSDASVKDVEEIYMRAWEIGCKGVTVFRRGSKKGVLE
jgi:ribonucleoside-diphosphate reductase alpha chain